MTDDELATAEHALNPGLHAPARKRAAALGLALAFAASLELLRTAIRPAVNGDVRPIILSGILVVSLLGVIAWTRPREPRISLTSEGMVLLGRRPALLSYADVDTIRRTGRGVVVHAGTRRLRLVPRVAGLIDYLVRYLEAQVARSRELAADRSAVTAYLARDAVTGDADYRHAAPPTSALEAIARAKGMPVGLRMEAARAAGIDEDDLDLEGPIKQYANYAKQ